MKKFVAQSMIIVAIMTLITVATMQSFAEARAGGGRSMGSRGSRSYSQPVAPSTRPSPYQQAPQVAPRPYTPPFQPQPAGGGFLRSMAGGMVGGMLGGMLFRSMGFGGGGWGGGGGFGGSGVGFFEIILLAGIAYLIFRMVRGRRDQATVYDSQQYQQPQSYQEPQQSYVSTAGDLEAGLSHIRQMDPGFSKEMFGDQVMDIFFKVQAAWMNRDLATAGQLVTDEMRRIFQEDMDRLRREQRINRLENIAVRSVEITEAWQEQGQDYITALIYANLLDYTTDESGRLVVGSNTEPVKFEEYWTFTRPVGSGGWRLSGIDQK